MSRKSVKFQAIFVLALVLLAPTLVAGIVYAQNTTFPITSPVTPPVTPPNTPSPTATPTATPTPAPYLIKVVSPNGGEKIVNGTPFTITWNSSKNFSYFYVEMWHYREDGQVDQVWSDMSAKDTGSLVWNIKFDKYGYYKAHVKGVTWNFKTFDDLSDNFVTIVAPTPNPTPTPSPSPTPNFKPIITTTAIPVAHVGKAYSAMISFYDLNIKDSVILNATGVTWLNNVSCTTKITSTQKTYVCIYSGTPSKAGFYTLNIQLDDQHGGKTNKKFILTVTK